MDKDKQYGVIQEQGDLGLGFEPLTEAEQTAVEKAEVKDETK